MSNDFFDGGLLKSSIRRDEPRAQGADSVSGQDPGAMVMARQKEDMTTQVAGAVKELELLRQRQRELEREKDRIEKLTRSQEEYEDGKRDLVAGLTQALVEIRKEQEDLGRATELYSATRERFERALAEVREINESEWEAADYTTRLRESLALVQNARAMFEMASAQLEAARWPRRQESGSGGQFESSAASTASGRGFQYWLMAGFAATLPLGVLVIILYIVHLVLRARV